MKQLTTIIMAGGKGERLFPLTRDKAKPVITFGSLYRIIDFTLSNCLNSGIRRIYVLSQYGSFSLDQHLRCRPGTSCTRTWGGIHLAPMPPQQIMVSRWYRGTVDSIFQNLNLLEAERPKHVLILSGDHVYKLNYREMLDFYLRRGGGPDGGRGHGAPGGGQLLRHSQGERPRGRWRISWKNPRTRRDCPTTPISPWCPWGSISSTPGCWWRRSSRTPSKRPANTISGGDIIPQMVGGKRCSPLISQDPASGTPRYWRDIGHVGRLPSRPTRDLLGRYAHLRVIRDPEWPMRSRPQLLPYPSKFIADRDAGDGGVTPSSPSGCYLHRRDLWAPVDSLPRGQGGAGRGAVEDATLA